MKLFSTPTSPFVRKVLVVAHELGLADRIELVTLRPIPLEASPELSAHNPLNKIPALVLDDGTALYDSPVICEYFQSLATDREVVPASGSERWRVLRVQALCDGILDAAILVFYERVNRPEAEWWSAWQKGQTEKALQGLDALEREVDHFGDITDLADISAGITLGWLEFRKPFGDVLASRPKLRAWYARFSERASMVATMPRA